MNVNDILARVERIRASAGDDEVAYGMEDDLHVEVLRAISQGVCEDPEGCAKATLLTLDIKFCRWCA